MSVTIHPSLCHVCQNCHNVSGFGVSATFDYESCQHVAIKCPHCQAAFPLENIEVDVGRFSKRDPDQKMPAWTVTIPVQEESAGFQEESSPDEPTYVSFEAKKRLLADGLLDSLKIIESMKCDLSELAQKITQQFNDTFTVADGVSQWDWGYMIPFVRQPFLGIPLPCDDPDAEPWTRALICPLFYRTQLGIPITTYGGFWVQIINAYTRLCFPVENAITKVLDVPPSIECHVWGKRLLGRSLSKIWKKIPGVLPDSVHREQEPSIVMGNSLDEQMECRAWLARHGIHPWQAVPINDGEIGMGILPILKDHEPLRPAWNQFRKVGRILVACDNTNTARIFGMLACYLVRGNALIITDTKQHRHWKSIMDGHPIAATMKHERIPICTWDQFENLESINAFPKIVIDISEDYPIEFLKQFYGYTGKLIVVSSDPLLDSMRENVIAPIVFGLVHSWWMHTEHPASGTHQWKRKWAEEGSPIWQAMQMLERDRKASLSEPNESLSLDEMDDDFDDV